MLFRRSPHARPLRIAERFVAPVARLSAVVVPLDVIAREKAARWRFLVMEEGAGNDHRAVTLAAPLSPDESLRLEFDPFAGAAGASYLLGVAALSGDDTSPVEADLRTLRAAASGRPPIGIECRGGRERTAADLLIEERGMAAFRVEAPGRSSIRTAHGLDAYWCDAHGLYLHGWAHAHEHRLRALRIESAGRSTEVETFKDRPDLLVHYPGHEHVRQAGFTAYLACPPGHPVHLTFLTEGGSATVPLALPEGPLPSWPPSPGDEEDADGLSPLLRGFVELANARGGRVLQVGSRSPAGHPAAPPRPVLRGPVIGVDIHPGGFVDLVSDAHGLALRDGSVDAVVSASVLEHLQAPWLFAAEVNRVLKPGGLVYHAAPGAWPAHAQPNDFWRMSAEGLRTLFGAESGFEVLDAQDSGLAAMIPVPRWRHRHLDMPTVPTFAMAEILARKVADLEPGAVAWPLKAGAARARLYPVAGLRVAPEPPESGGGTL